MKILYVETKNKYALTCMSCLNHVTQADWLNEMIHALKNDEDIMKKYRLKRQKNCVDNVVGKRIWKTYNKCIIDLKYKKEVKFNVQICIAFNKTRQEINIQPFYYKFFHFRQTMKTCYYEFGMWVTKKYVMKWFNHDFCRIIERYDSHETNHKDSVGFIN